MKEYLAAKLAAKRKNVRVVTRKGPPKRQPRIEGGQAPSLPHPRAAEDSVDSKVFEVYVREFMVKAGEYCQEIDKLPHSLALAIQKALAERIALKVLTSYTQATLPSDSATAGTSETSLPLHWPLQK